MVGTLQVRRGYSENMKTARNSKTATETDLAEKLLKMNNPMARLIGKARMDRIKRGEPFLTREQILEQVERTREGRA
jgi:uncharacterized Fe-S cluster-containing radical SAM superfamily protein